MTARFTVYIHRDKSGAVVYVGATSNLAVRTRYHRRHAHWWSLVDEALTTTIECGSAAEAATVEYELLTQLRPPGNHRGVRSRYAAYRGGGPRRRHARPLPVGMTPREMQEIARQRGLPSRLRLSRPTMRAMVARVAQEVPALVIVYQEGVK